MPEATMLVPDHPVPQEELDRVMLKFINIHGLPALLQGLADAACAKMISAPWTKTYDYYANLSHDIQGLADKAKARRP
jgi:hypothetical protein